MPCYTRLKPKQTISQRADELRRITKKLDELIMRRRVQLKVGPQGAVAFIGWTEADRDGVTDNCAYRRLLVEGSALTRMEMAKAERLAGRNVDRQVVGRGVHSHDGGNSWNDKG